MNFFEVIVFTTCTGWVCCAYQLQILHTNDMHAHFAEVDEYASSCTEADARAGKCYGGFARIRRAAIEAKKEARQKNISSIFLNAGDTFQGTPYYTIYKWRVAASIINTLEFDAMCLGNHEFDDGVNNLVEYLTHVKTVTVTANLNRTSDMRLNETLVKNSTVLEVDGVKIGIVGYLTPDTMMNSRTESLHIHDEIPCIRKEAKRLKAAGVNIIIGLGHSGLKMDKKIAKEVEELDIIVGGHSHSLLYAPTDQQPSTETIDDPYPTWITQKSGKRVPIVQSSAFTKYFGRLMVTFDDKWKVTSAEGNSHLLNQKHAKDSAVESLVQSWTSQLRSQLNKTIGNTRVLLEKPDLKTGRFPSNIANLITDAIFETGVFLAKEENNTQWTKYAVAVYQNGGIRSQITNKKRGGNLTLEDMMMVLPFQNQLFQCGLNGQDLKQLLELSVIEYEPKEKYFHYFLFFSGLRVNYDLERPPGDRIVSIMVLCQNCSVPKYEPLDKNQKYLIILNDFLLRGGDDYYIFKTSCTDVKNLNFAEIDSVIDYIQRREVIYTGIDDRLQVSGYGKLSNAGSKCRSSLYIFLVALLVLVRADA